MCGIRRLCDNSPTGISISSGPDVHGFLKHRQCIHKHMQQSCASVKHLTTSDLRVGLCLAGGETFSGVSEIMLTGSCCTDSLLSITRHSSVYLLYNRILRTGSKEKIFVS